MQDKAAWDQAYARGAWDRLDEPREVSHYATIAGYCSYFLHPSDAILDLGCGEGLLLAYLGRGFVERYIGVDLSDVALEKARFRHARLAPAPDFRACAVERFTPPPGSTYGAIVFNEVLYYLDEPVRCAARLCAHLRPGGLVIVSMWEGTLDRLYPDAVRIWPELYAMGWPVADETAITHTPTGNRWRVTAFRPNAK